VRLSDAGPVASAFWRTMIANRPLIRATRRPSSSATSPTVGRRGLFFACDLGVWHWRSCKSVATRRCLPGAHLCHAGWLFFRRVVTRTFRGMGQSPACSSSGVPRVGDRLAGDAQRPTAVFYGLHAGEPARCRAPPRA
jgi:hypothetical protein